MVYKIRNITTGLFHVPAGPRGTGTQHDKWTTDGMIYASINGVKSAVQYLHQIRGYNRSDLEIVFYNMVEITAQPA